MRSAEKMTATNEMFSRRWGVLLARTIALFLIVGLGGCYATKFPLFGRAEGILIAGLEGDYRVRVMDVHETYRVSREGRGNDYRFKRIEGHSDDPGEGILRVVKITDRLYIAQITFDFEPGDKWDYPSDEIMYILFDVVRSGGVVAKLEELEAKSTAAKKMAEEIARRHHVDAWGRLGPAGLSGSPKELKRFLLEMAECPLEPDFVFARVN
jgi:hypothetical protein